jgi:hypothetical protein
MHKAIRKGASIKLVDSDLSGVFVTYNADGSVSIETAEGLLIPVKLSNIIISDSDSMQTLGKVRGRGNKDKVALSGQGNRKSKPADRVTLRDKDYTAMVDLHMKTIPDAKNGPSPTDILERQLSRFTIELKRAVAEHKKELIVIHGEGSGKLKEEVRRLSKSLYPQYIIMDAPLHKYGSGASIIILK